MNSNNEEFTVPSNWPEWAQVTAGNIQSMKEYYERKICPYCGKTADCGDICKSCADSREEAGFIRRSEA